MVDKQEDSANSAPAMADNSGSGVDASLDHPEQESYNSNRKNLLNNEHVVNEPNMLFFDNAVHYRKESTFSQYDLKMNLDGFKNFLYVILVISIGRLILENLDRYGMKANPITWVEKILNDPHSLWLTYLVLGVNVFALVCMLLERFYVFYLESMGRVQQHHLPESMATFSPKSITQTLNVLRFKTNDKEEKLFQLVYMGNLTIMLLVPVAYNWFARSNPYLYTFICIWYASSALKLYSYHQVNSWWRTGKLYQGKLQPTNKTNESLELYQGETLRSWNPSKLIFYPNNLTVVNVLRFIYSPTMCYQCNFPLKKSRNYLFMLRCFLELIFLIELSSVLTQQWVIIPLQDNHFALDQITFTQFLLRWTKMSLATITIWVISFYCLFQSFFNLVAEILLFADRQFYEDWWNSRTVSEFWRKWNLPVHRWCKRHLFKPMLLRGYSPLQATAFIFFASGLVHEYVISVPLMHLSVHFVLGMSSQIIFEAISVNIRSWHLANAFLWCSMILGQPLLIIMYHNDVRNAYNYNTTTNLTTTSIIH